MEMTEQERYNRAIQCVRLYIRDKKEINRLLLGNFESTDLDIRMALTMAIDDWNTTPPNLGRVTIKNHPAKTLMLLFTVYHVVRGAIMWHAREHMPSSDGGTSADDHAKFAEYTAWNEALKSDYEQKKGDFKAAQNISAALQEMGVSSEYSWMEAFGDDLRW